MCLYVANSINSMYHSMPSQSGTYTTVDSFRYKDRRGMGRNNDKLTYKSTGWQGKVHGDSLGRYEIGLAGT
jgi:hypothetical protein